MESMKQLQLFLSVYLMSFSIQNVINASTSQHAYAQDSFDQVFKPISLDYLYQLFDDHPESKEMLDEFFKVKQVIHPLNKKNKKLVAYSLFWKCTSLNGQQPVVNPNTIHDPALGRKGESFHSYYVNPMKKVIKYFKENEKNTVVRIYLANDLEFLVPELSYSNVEIYLMSSSSVGHSPGAMWRFLALTDDDAKVVCIKDSDDKVNERKENKINDWINDSETSGWYRFSSYKFQEDLNSALYSPIIANNFGVKRLKGIDIEKAMKGFILHRELLIDEPRHPRDIPNEEHPYGFGNQFPVYGLDERFLKHVIYFHAAGQGKLTTLVLKSDHKDKYKELKHSSKKFLVEKDYDFIFKRNKHPIYY
jgi:hypothetical protein